MKNLSKLLACGLLAATLAAPGQAAEVPTVQKGKLTVAFTGTCPARVGAMAG